MQLKQIEIYECNRAAGKEVDFFSSCRHLLTYLTQTGFQMSMYEHGETGKAIHLDPAIWAESFSHGQDFLLVQYQPPIIAKVEVTGEQKYNRVRVTLEHFMAGGLPKDLGDLLRQLKFEKV